ncbi:MAG: diphthine synthase [Pyrodictiaceae archaeon]
MPLYIVGAGLSWEYLTLKALQILSKADKIYIDTYTSIAPGIDKETLRKLNPWAEIVEATRSLLEENQRRIIEEAREKNVVVLVPGDPHHATTHIALQLEALAYRVEAYMIPGVSGLQAVIDASGLQVYRFGKPVTLVYPEEYYKPYTAIETIRENRQRDLHTLVLLDLRLDQAKAMTIPEAIDILLELEKEYTKKTREDMIIPSSIIVGVARAGLEEQKCKAGTPEEVKREEYPPPPHTIIVAAPRLHPLEEEALQALCGYKRATIMEK